MATNINFNSSLGVVKNSIVITQAGGLDPDAQAFITAAAITDATQISAINQLVVSLKGASLWTKILALYPFVGGTAFAHKFNLKDPQDTDAAFRIVFSGGWVHSSNGIQMNGTNTFGDTKVAPITNLAAPADIHVAYYSRTNGVGGADFGAALNSSFTRGMWLMPRYTDNKLYTSILGNTSVINATSYNPSTGFLMIRRNNLTNVITSQNGANTTLNQNFLGYSGSTLTFGAINLFTGTRTLYSNRQLAFGSIGLGLTDTDATNYNTIVQTFQTTLGRNV
jgi:hypothetical protein